MLVSEEPHDPLQCVKQLRQFLSVGKLSVGFFLGAGCPAAVRRVEADQKEGEPLIPDIKGITKKVRDQVSGSQECGKAFAQLGAVFKEDGEDSPTIETMLNRVRAMRDVAGKGDVRGLSFSDLESLDQAICQTTSNIVACDLPSEATPYHALARFIGTRRDPSSEIFTTNYDLLMEQALEAHRVAYFDGFLGSSRPFFDQRAIDEDALPPRWSRLWKLHGSINWRFNKKSKAIFRSREKSSGDLELLIHPSHRKYDESRRMPYFVMMDRLRNYLRNEGNPVALIFLGYSFSDEHINEIVIESLNANQSAAAFALQYSNLSDYGVAEALAMDNANLSLFARDAAVIRRRKAEWMVRPTTDIAALKGVFQVKPRASAPTQKEKESTPETGSSEELQPCEFLIGDFRDFGGFLDAVFGAGATATAESTK